MILGGGSRVIRKIDHLGIAVKNIDEVLKVYSEGLGLHFEKIEEVPEQKVKTAFLEVGSSHVELLESTDPEGPVGKFIESRGEGIHHVAFRVDDIRAAIDRAKEKGLKLLNETPRIGAGGALIVFLHPKSAGGVLIELCQRPE
jgi:methylmalonyl-CoA epimerase